MSVFKLLFLFVGSLFIQWWLSTHVGALDSSPRLLLVLTMALAARVGPTQGMVMGFGWGIFLDILRAHLFGANALLLTLAAYGTGMARRQIDVAGVGPQMVAVLIMSWSYFILMGVLGAVFARAFFWPGWLAVFVTPIYNCLLVPFVFIFLERYLAVRR